MRSNRVTIISGIALLALAAGCDRGEPDGQVVAVETDSGAVATAAAQAIASTLQSATQSEPELQRRWLLTPGPTRWDTMLVDELRRAEPSMSEEAGDTSMVTTVSTHGFVERGDTIEVTVVIRSCARSDTAFNFTRDSLVHLLVRGRGASGDEWEQTGPVIHDHAVGECDPLPAARTVLPNG